MNFEPPSTMPAASPADAADHHCDADLVEGRVEMEIERRIGQREVERLADVDSDGTTSR